MTSFICQSRGVEGKKKDPRSYFKFKDDGTVITKSGQAEKTFNFPDLKVGFLFDAVTVDIMPLLAIELYEFKKVPIYFDFGLAPHLVYVSCGYNIVKIFEIGVFVWAGYNFDERSNTNHGIKFYGASFGLGVTVLKF